MDTIFLLEDEPGVVQMSNNGRKGMEERHQPRNIHTYQPGPNILTPEEKRYRMTEDTVKSLFFPVGRRKMIPFSRSVSVACGESP